MRGIEYGPANNTVKERCRDVRDEYPDCLVRLTSERVMRAQEEAVRLHLRLRGGIDQEVRQEIRRQDWEEVQRKVLRQAPPPPHHRPAETLHLLRKSNLGVQERLETTHPPAGAEERGDRVGRMPLDSAYVPRKNAQLIANIGATPYTALKEDASSALPHGRPA